jgi:hypothetical protein
MALKQRLAEQEQIDAARMQNVLLLLQDLFKREEATVKKVLSLLYDVGSVHVIDEKVPIRSLDKPLRILAKLSKPVFGFAAIRWFQANCPKLIIDWLYPVVTFQPQADQQPSTVATQVVAEVEDASLSTADRTPGDRPQLTAQTSPLQIEPQEDIQSATQIPVQSTIDELLSERSPLTSSELAELAKLVELAEPAESLQAGLQQIHLQEIQHLRQQIRWVLGGAIGAVVFAGASGVWLGYNFKAGTFEQGFNGSHPVPSQKFNQG